ncbi:unnamed protein product [Macrosiphum euphorbiae]|uniref:Uncharacterized protein n=1 Tax=Macrosiphum euphorbiae TaxID=13131 RepID=A0AAV0XJ22_9HEMI|nr:unnamed protein product [Macrosiphum euphorbiae]
MYTYIVFDYTSLESSDASPVAGAVDERHVGTESISALRQIRRGEEARRRPEYVMSRCYAPRSFVMPDLLSHKGLEPFNFDRVGAGSAAVTMGL